MTRVARASLAIATVWLTAMVAVACGPSGGSPPGTPAFRGPIVIVTLSALSAHASSDAEVRTPALDRFVADATWSGRGIASATWSTASLASVMTGLPPSVHGATHPAHPWLRPDVPTLSQQLSAAGFATRAFYASAWSGPGFGLERGFESARPVKRRAAERWLAGLPEGPSFTWIEVPLPGSSLATAGIAEEDGEDEGGDAKSAEPGTRAARLEEADRRLRRLLEALERGGHEDEALVIVLGDHGDAAATGAPVAPGLDLGRASIEVPLAIRAPEALRDRFATPRGSTVGLDRLYATVLELAGIQPSPSAAPSLLRPSAWVAVSELWFAGGRHEVALYEDGHQLRWRCDFAAPDPGFEPAWREALGSEGSGAYGDAIRRLEVEFTSRPGCAVAEGLVLEAWTEEGGVVAVDDDARRERMAERLRNLRHFPPISCVGPERPAPVYRRRDFFSLTGWGLPVPRQWGPVEWDEPGEASRPEGESSRPGSSQ